MAEQEDTQTQEPTPQGDAQQAQPEESQQEERQTDWKAEARKWEARAKADHQRVKELQPQVEDTTKLTQQVEQLSAQVDRYKSTQQKNQWRAKISHETGVDPSFLNGSTLEEMRENGKKLAAYIDERVKATRPQPPIIPGVETQHSASPSDGMRELSRALFGRN